MNQREALKLALEALDGLSEPYDVLKAQEAIKEALAQPEQNEFNPDWDAMAVMVEEQQRMAKRIAELEAQQEPVATLWQHGETGRTRITMPGDITDCDARWFKAADLYTTPPQRKPLTDDEIVKITSDPCLYIRGGDYRVDIARAIEAAHGIKE